MDLRFESTEKECNILGTYFQSVVTDMKTTAPVWDDFVNKGTKLHGLLKTTTYAVSSFLESLQKIADVVTQSKGTTKDIGSVLTRLCVRQKMIETKLKQFTNVMLECLLVPIQDRLDEWKKVSVQLEKDHAKEHKRATNEIKKKSSDTIRLQKKVRKGSKSDVQYQLSSMMQDVNDKFILLGETEKASVKNLLIEERSRACFLSTCLAPFLEVEVSMLNEVTHLQDILTELSKLSRDPRQLPASAEQLMSDLLNGQDITNLTLNHSSSSGHLSSHTYGSSPPSSPNTNDSRKSSMCSLNSCDSRSSSSHSHSSSGNFPFHHGGKSGNSQQPITRLMSISSHDSGFGSASAHDVNSIRSKPSSPSQKLNHQYSMNDMDSEPTSPPVIKPHRSLSTPGESVVPLKMQMNRKHNQIPNNTNHTTNTVLPSRLVFDPVNVQQKNVEQNSSPQGICDPTFFTPPKENGTTYPNIPPVCQTDSTWGSSVDDLPPPPEDMLFPTDSPTQNNHVPTPTNTDSQERTERNIKQNDSNIITTNEVASLQQNFARQSISSNITSYNNSTTLGSRSSLSSGEFLATMTLGRKNSNNSLQYSSGYSSQQSTPACSEDTIASHDTDYSSVDGEEFHSNDNMREFERWSTLPRPRHNPAQRTTHRTARPASTSGFPNNNQRPSSIVGYPNNSTGPTIINSPGTATIKRKPSSKFSSVNRRMNAPLPVQPPTAPSVMATPQPSNHYGANHQQPNRHSPVKRHQSEGMFVGVNSYYYNHPMENGHISNKLNSNIQNSFINNNNSSNHNGAYNESESPPPLPPREPMR